MATRSVETTLLIQYLMKCHREGKPATYAEMNKLIHADVQSKERAKLTSALDILKREGMHFEAISGEGYRPLSDKELAAMVGFNRQSKIRSQARKWRDELESVDISKLTQPEIQEYSKSVVKLSAHEYVLSPEVNKKLEDRAVRTTGLEYAKEAIAALKDIS